MEQPEPNEPEAAVSASASNLPGPIASPAGPVAGSPATRQCPTCGTSMQYSPASNIPITNPYVLALGTIGANFRDLGQEKEYAHVTRQAKTANLTDREALRTVLSQSENLHLAKAMYWDFKIQGIQHYILEWGDLAELGMLIDSLRPNPEPGDIDVVVGHCGPVLSSPELYNGLVLPIVHIVQILSFPRESFINSLVESIRDKEKKMPETNLKAAAKELFDRIIQMAANGGRTDEERARNHCALHYPSIYENVALKFAEDSALTGLDVRTHPLTRTGTRKIVELIFSFTNRKTDVTEKHSVRVDTTDQFTFLASKWGPYLDK